MAERVIKPKVKTGDNTADYIKIPYSVIYGAPDISVYSKTYVYYMTGDGQSAGYDIEHNLGADVNVSVYLMGQSIFGETVDELVMVDVYTKLNKVKLVFNSAPSSDMKFKVVITGAESEKIDTLEETSWGKIREIVLAGKAGDYWSVGDTKSITSKSGKTYTIRLADLQDGRYEYSDGSGSSKAVFEFVELYNLNGTTKWQINSTLTDVTWAECEMRTQTMPTIFADLPDDMTAVMSEVKVTTKLMGSVDVITSSSVDKLFLLSDPELYAYGGGSGESSFGVFDYYKTTTEGEDWIKRNVGTASANSWWLRNPSAGLTNGGGHLGVNATGARVGTQATNRFSIAPIFAI